MLIKAIKDNATFSLVCTETLTTLETTKKEVAYKD